MFEEKVQNEYEWIEVIQKPFGPEYRLALALIVALDIFVVVYGARFKILSKLL